jgi:hypothetical protein
MLLFARKTSKTQENLVQEHEVTCENFDFPLFRKNTSNLNTGDIWWKKDKLKPLVASSCIVCILVSIFMNMSLCSTLMDQLRGCFSITKESQYISVVGV